MGFATLGPITFEVSADKVRTWHEAKRNGSARFAKHDVHLDWPKLEFLGPDLDELTLSIRLDINRGLVPRGELRQIAEQCKTGKVLPFAVGGEPAGDYVIKSFAETWTRLDAKGVLTTAIVELNLQEYL